MIIVRLVCLKCCMHLSAVSLQPVVPQRPRLPILASQRLSEDLIEGRLLTEWQLTGSERKAEALRSKLQRVYRDLRIVRSILLPAGLLSLWLCLLVSSSYACFLNALMRSSFCSLWVLRQEANTSRPCFHGLLLNGQIDDALRQAELQDARAKEILKACNEGYEEVFGSPSFPVAASADVRMGTPQLKRRKKVSEGHHEHAAAEALSQDPKRQCRHQTSRTAVAGTAKRADTGTAGKGTGGATELSPPGLDTSCRRHHARLEDIKVLDGTPFRSPPMFLCSNTTLVICPPFLARHWEAQLEQWFGWQHLPAADRMKVRKAGHLP